MARARAARDGSRRVPRRSAADRAPGLALAGARVVGATIRDGGPSRRRNGAARLHASRSPPVVRTGDGRDRARSRSPGYRPIVDLVVLAEVRWGYFRTRKQFLLSR